MSLKDKLDRIEKEIEAGLKLKSADRLRNLLNEYPNEPLIWEKLGQLYYDSGFLDGAGRYWVLTEPTDEKIEKCVKIYLDSVNHSGTQILQDITFRGDKDKLPEYSRNKLIEFETDSKLKSKYIPTFKPRRNKQQRQNKNSTETFKDKLVKWLIIGFLLIMVFFGIVGIITTFSWIF